MRADYIPYTLEFKKPARTSRGELTTHRIWIIRLHHQNQIGYGEAAPLPGLSIDFRDDFEQQLQTCCAWINDGLPVDALPLAGFPSLRFAFESAFAALSFPQPFTYFNSGFIQGERIPINGLVWMDTREAMLKQAQEKLEQGYTCLKFKIGAIDFDEECRLLEAVRKYRNAFSLEIRLDANGAFGADDVFEKLKDLKRFDIHSIEQPVKQGQPVLMQEVVAKSAIPIALDEELIGIEEQAEMTTLLQLIQPHYIILKPTLIGGLSMANQWIATANQNQTGWWATSALESSIGLNIIAQWVTFLGVRMPQGLGTGALYTNNIASPVKVKNAHLIYDSTTGWEIPDV